jgi:hypothetical protein
MNLPKRPDPINGSSSSAATPCCCSWNFKWMRNHQERKLYLLRKKKKASIYKRCDQLNSGR